MDNTNINVTELPGTARIRKLSSYMTSMEMLELSARMASEGYEKKLFSILSRVYSDKKGFGGEYQEGMDSYVKTILDADIPSEYKLQTFTSFELPEALLPEVSFSSKLIETCDKKRLNIAAHYIRTYHLYDALYSTIMADTDLFNEVILIIDEDDVLGFYKKIFEGESKELITGTLRSFGKSKRKLKYRDKTKITELTSYVFESRSVFFTSKLLFCSVFAVPESVLKNMKDLNKILKISINYDEKVTKEFVKIYNLDFDCSDKALCQYYIGNKKAANEKTIVLRFASHLMRIQNESDRKYLLRGAFKRGGYFRMYAGCMQDGCIDPVKMKRFHYSEEDVNWCSTLPGLKNN